MRNLLATSLTLAAVSLAQPAHALNILLTNDDGCRAPGIDALHRALVAAGHQVTLIAPDKDNSGIGAASVVSPGQPLAVTELAPGKYCVGAPAGFSMPAGKNMAIGTPVDAVNVGLDLLLKDNPPDLVVSGSNFGDNVGPLTQMSGTVNAAVRAMFKGVPAVAVSTAIDLELIMRDQQAGYLQTLNAMDDTANFTVKLIETASVAGAEAKRRCSESGGKARPFCELNVLGLPGSTGLNINYPAREAGEVAGVSHAPIGDWGMVGFQAQRDDQGVVRVNLVPPATPTAEQQRADAYQLFIGNAVVSVIDGNLSASPALQKQTEKMLEGLTP